MNEPWEALSWLMIWFLKEEDYVDCSLAFATTIPEVFVTWLGLRFLDPAVVLEYYFA